MERWVLSAFISMVIAKLGLNGISGDLGLAVRTCFVLAFVLIFAAVVVPAGQVKSLTTSNLLWLALSGVTTAF